jgi:cystathionine beta-synthase
MTIYQSVLDLIGRTPLVYLNSLGKGLPGRICAKLEYMNPGGSVKDRIALPMIEAAEKEGKLKPGGTIIEGTSGNTGVGLALAAAIKGYKAVFTIQDKQSREKINLLKAFGAEVVVCPTAVEPEDPRSYYSVSKRLSEELPNAFYPYQYGNDNNPRAHYESTGPEIWEDTEGKLDYFVCGLGTGGTATGVGRYLKEKNSDVKIVGADPIGSMYYDYFHSGKVVPAHTYLTEGIGEDFFPTTMDFEVLDDCVQVSDKESFLMARRLAREEAIFTGGSGGTAMVAALETARKANEGDLIVVLLPDSGQRYLSKVFNDEWMRENQFIETGVRMSARDVVAFKRGRIGDLKSVAPDTPLSEALADMKRLEISQLPVFDGGQPVGCVYEDHMIDLLLEGRDLSNLVCREIMGDSFPVVDQSETLGVIAQMIGPKTPAVLVKMDDTYEIITKYDLLNCITADGGQA